MYYTTMKAIDNRIIDNVEKDKNKKLQSQKYTNNYIKNGNKKKYNEM